MSTGRLDGLNELEQWFLAQGCRLEYRLTTRAGWSAVVLRSERGAGEKPLVTHVLEAYFELLFEAGIEQAVEAYVPRSENPDTINAAWTLWDIVAGIIDRENPGELRPLSGFVSRLMLGGHQLPGAFTTGQPPKPSGFEPLVQLTGQQVPVSLPEPDEDAEDDE